MILKIKKKMRDFLQWQVRVGADTDYISMSIEKVLAEIKLNNNRFDSFQKLNNLIVDDTIKTADAAKSDAAYSRLLLESYLRKINESINAIENKVLNIEDVAKTERVEAANSSLSLEKFMISLNEQISNIETKITAIEEFSSYNRNLWSTIRSDGTENPGLLQEKLLSYIEKISIIENKIEKNKSFFIEILNGKPNFPFAYLGNTIGLATTSLGHRIYIDTRDRQIAPHLATSGIWEPWNTTLIQSILKKDDKVVEVGANFGYFTVLMGYSVGKNGKIISFEANQALVDLLKASIEINGLTRQVDVRGIAVNDTSGDLEFSVYGNFLGDGHISTLHSGRHINQNFLRIPSDTLDNQLSNEKEIRLLRLDAEGSESRIIRGAKNLIQRSPDMVIIMEWGLWTEDNITELAFLEESGFKFYKILEDAKLLSITVDNVSDYGLLDILCYRGDIGEFGFSAYSS